MTTVQRLGLITGLLGLSLGLIAPFSQVAPPVQCALGFALFALCFWTFEPVPIQFSSLLLLILYPLSGLLSFEQSFGPFAGKTVWLIFTGMVISTALDQTGVGALLATFLKRFLSRNPARLILQLHLVGLATALIVPSGVVRVVVLFPIGLALCSSFKEMPDEKLNTAILLSLTSSTVFGGFGILTGAVPNMIIAGQFQTWGTDSIFWSTWFFWMFPIVGLSRTLLSAIIIWFFWGRYISTLKPTTTDIAIPPLSLEQKKTVGVLSLGITGWATDSLHHIAPVYVAFLVTLLLLLPLWGTIDFSELKKIDFSFLFYIAALFSLGTALGESGFNDYFILRAVEWVDLAAWEIPHRYFALTLLTVPLDFFMDIAAVAAVVTHPFLDLAVDYGLQPLPAIMSIGMATTLVFLPYQAAPFMVAYSFKKFALFHLILLQFTLSLLSLLVLYPINIAYWWWAGLL